MLEQIGRFVGMAAADVVHFFRGRQTVPCTVDWERPPGGWFPFGSHVDFAGDLEFSSQLGEDGLPMWERPLPLTETAQCCGTCENGCWNV